MKNNRREKGQTTIETALMMIFLLVLFFGISEIARAWWLKNQLNNAARVAVRVAIVDSALPGETLPLTNIACSWSGSTCTTASADKAIISACNSITNRNLCGNGGLTSARVTVELVPPDVLPSGVSSGDTIKVTVTGVFQSVVPNLASLSFGLFRSIYIMPASASMRYE